MAPVQNINSRSVASSSSSSASSSFSSRSSHFGESRRELGDHWREFTQGSRSTFDNDSFFGDARTRFSRRAQHLLDRWDALGVLDDDWFETEKFFDRQSGTGRRLQVSKIKENQVFGLVSKNGDYKIMVDLGQFKSRDIKVRVNKQRKIEVEGVRRIDYGTKIADNTSENFHYEFSLPDNADVEATTSTLSSDGFLIITIPVIRHQINNPVFQRSVVHGSEISNENCVQNSMVIAKPQSYSSHQVSSSSSLTEAINNSRKCIGMESPLSQRAQELKGISAHSKNIREIKIQAVDKDHTFFDSSVYLPLASKNSLSTNKKRITGSFDSDSYTDGIDIEIENVAKNLLKRKSQNLSKGAYENRDLEPEYEIVKLKGDHFCYMFTLELKDFMSDGEIDVKFTACKEIQIQCSRSKSDVSSHANDVFIEKLLVPEDALTTSAKAYVVPSEKLLIIVFLKDEENTTRKSEELIIPITFEDGCNIGHMINEKEKIVDLSSSTMCSNSSTVTDELCLQSTNSENTVSSLKTEGSFTHQKAALTQKAQNDTSKDNVTEDSQLFAMGSNLSNISKSGTHEDISKSSRILSRKNDEKHISNDTQQQELKMLLKEKDCVNSDKEMEGQPSMTSDDFIEEKNINESHDSMNQIVSMTTNDRKTTASSSDHSSFLQKKEQSITSYSDSLLETQTKGIIEDTIKTKENHENINSDETLPPKVIKGEVESTVSDTFLCQAIQEKDADNSALNSMMVQEAEIKSLSLEKSSLHMDENATSAFPSPNDANHFHGRKEDSASCNDFTSFIVQESETRQSIEGDSLSVQVSETDYISSDLDANLLMKQKVETKAPILDSDACQLQQKMEKKSTASQNSVPNLKQKEKILFIKKDSADSEINEADTMSVTSTDSLHMMTSGTYNYANHSNEAISFNTKEIKAENLNSKESDFLDNLEAEFDFTTDDSTNLGQTRKVLNYSTSDDSVSLTNTNSQHKSHVSNNSLPKEEQMAKDFGLTSDRLASNMANTYYSHGDESVSLTVEQENLKSGFLKGADQSTEVNSLSAEESISLEMDETKAKHLSSVHCDSKVALSTGSTLIVSEESPIPKETKEICNFSSQNSLLSKNTDDQIRCSYDSDIISVNSQPKGSLLEDANFVAVKDSVLLAIREMLSKCYKDCECKDIITCYRELKRNYSEENMTIALELEDDHQLKFVLDISHIDDKGRVKVILNGKHLEVKSQLQEEEEESKTNWKFSRSFGLPEDFSIGTASAVISSDGFLMITLTEKNVSTHEMASEDERVIVKQISLCSTNSNNEHKLKGGKEEKSESSNTYSLKHLSSDESNDNRDMTFSAMKDRIKINSSAMKESKISDGNSPKQMVGLNETTMSETITQKLQETDSVETADVMKPWEISNEDSLQEENAEETRLLSHSDHKVNESMYFRDSKSKNNSEETQEQNLHVQNTLYKTEKKKDQFTKCNTELPNISTIGTAASIMVEGRGFFVEDSFFDCAKQEFVQEMRKILSNHEDFPSTENMLISYKMLRIGNSEEGSHIATTFEDDKKYKIILDITENPDIAKTSVAILNEKEIVIKYLPTSRSDTDAEFSEAVSKHFHFLNDIDVETVVCGLSADGFLLILANKKLQETSTLYEVNVAVSEATSEVCLSQCTDGGQMTCSEDLELSDNDDDNSKYDENSSTSTIVALTSPVIQTDDLPIAFSPSHKTDVLESSNCDMSLAQSSTNVQIESVNEKGLRMNAPSFDSTKYLNIAMGHQSPTVNLHNVDGSDNVLYDGSYSSSNGGFSLFSSSAENSIAISGHSDSVDTSQKLSKHCNGVLLEQKQSGENSYNKKRISQEITSENTFETSQTDNSHFTMKQFLDGFDSSQSEMTKCASSEGHKGNSMAFLSSYTSNKVGSGSVKLFKIMRRGLFFEDSYFSEFHHLYEAAMRKVLTSVKEEDKCKHLSDIQSYKCLRKQNPTLQNQAFHVQDDQHSFKVLLDTDNLKETSATVYATESKELVIQGHLTTVEDTFESSQIYKRSFSLPAGIDLGVTTVSLSDDGVLLVVCPK